MNILIQVNINSNNYCNDQTSPPGAPCVMFEESGWGPQGVPLESEIWEFSVY